MLNLFSSTPYYSKRTHKVVQQLGLMCDKKRITREDIEKALKEEFPFNCEPDQDEEDLYIEEIKEAAKVLYDFVRIGRLQRGGDW